MSYLYPNPANQLAGASGATIVVPLSGFARVAVVDRLNPVSHGATVFNSDNDDLVGDEGLFTVAENFGWDELLGQWSRFRVTSSGEGVVGIPHRLVVVSSGDSIHIGGPTSTGLAAVDSRSFDTGGGADLALYTISSMYGYDAGEDQWPRLRVTSSGQGIVDIPHKLVVTFSGEQVALFSGKNEVQIRGGAPGQQLAEVQTANSDTLGDGTDALVSEALNYGFNDVTTAWCRLRAVPVSSGMTNISGVPLPFSGYFLGTTSLIIDDRGVIANIRTNTDSDTEGTQSSALGAQSYQYGYNEVIGAWARMRAVNVNQGDHDWVPPVSGFALMNVAAIAGMDGALARVHDFIDTDDRDPGTDSLAVESYSMGYNETADKWTRLRTLVPTSGQGYALLTKPAEPTTYITKTSNQVVLTSGNWIFTIFNANSRKIKIKMLRVTNTSNVISGQDLRLNINRIYDQPTGGTSRQAFPADEDSGLSGIALTIMQQPTNVIGSDNLFTYTTTNRGMNAGTGDNISNTSGVSTTAIAPHILQSMNLVDMGPGTESLVCHDSDGIGIKNDSSVTSGQFCVMIVYTVEDN